MGKLEANKLRNRTRILDAGYEVFAELGLDKATVADIVERTGLARGTFYNYFDTKEAVWEAVILQLAGEAGERSMAARRKADDPYTFVADAFRAYFEMITEDPRLLTFIRRNQSALRSTLLGSAAMRALYEALEHDLAASEMFGPMDEVRVTVVSSAMMGLGFEILFRAADKGLEIDPETWSREIARLFVDGLQGM